GRTAAALTEAISTGALTEADLDHAVERILRAIARLLALRDQHVSTADFERHHRLARRAAAESAVLLTNENAFLPLDPAVGGKLAVLGEFARTPRYQGGGSSHVRPTRLETALEELTKTVDSRREIGFAPGFSR